MDFVVIESPYAGTADPTTDRFAYDAQVRRNLRYLRACLRDSLLKGEAPFASHALYTQKGVLDDTIPDQRAMGIAAEFAIAERADRRVFYMDLRPSSGMKDALEICEVQAAERIENGVDPQDAATHAFRRVPGWARTESDYWADQVADVMIRYESLFNARQSWWWSCRPWDKHASKKACVIGCVFVHGRWAGMLPDMKDTYRSKLEVIRQAWLACHPETKPTLRAGRWLELVSSLSSVLFRFDKFGQIFDIGVDLDDECPSIFARSKDSHGEQVVANV